MRIAHPSTALEILVLFQQGKLALTERDYDQALDEVVDVLEKCNDEKHRLIPTPKGE